MCVGFQEFIIKNYVPLSLIHLSMAMCHEWTVGSLSTKVLCCESLEGIWELTDKAVNFYNAYPRSLLTDAK